jgi:branched-chain amino acid aminotransferase
MSDPLGLACLDGEVLPVAQARIPVTDEGLLRGDGVFEAMRLYNGVPFALSDHLDRMVRSAAHMRLPFDRQAMFTDVAALLSQARPTSAALRILITRGGHRLVLLQALPPEVESLSLGVVPYAPTRVLDEVKSLSYAANMRAQRLAQERGFDEALLVTPHGRVLEAPTSTFFWVRDGEILTPPLSDHVLDSISRRVLVADAGAREAVTALDDLQGAQEAFIASSLREVTPVHRIEELELLPGGPVTTTAAGVLSAHIAAATAPAG